MNKASLSAVLIILFSVFQSVALMLQLTLTALISSVVFVAVGYVVINCGQTAIK